MKELIEAVFLGVVQGITEWLPISSSGHLVIVKNFLGTEPSVASDIILHLGSLLVILFVFRKKIMSLIKGVFEFDKDSFQYILMLAVATIPIAIVGLVFNDIIKGAFDNILFVGGALVFTSIMLFMTKLDNNDGSRGANELDFKNTLLIGLMQSLAILPGVSRSAMTISTGMIQGVKKKDLAEFAFLLFIPAILGAIVLEIDSVKMIENVGLISVSFISTIITGYLSLKFLLKVIKNKNFGCFGWYTLNIGVLLIVIELFF